jgi:Zn-dependent peptidase ImmA (M78 family)
MNLLLDTIKSILPAANRKAHDFADVERLAKREKISIVLANYRPDILGYYTTRRNGSRLERFIMINSLLKNEPEKTFVGLHELGHHFLHAPISWRAPFYCRSTCELSKSKFDCEADAFALIAMIPTWLLIEMHDACFASLDPAMVPFLTRRQKLFETYWV